MPTRPRTSWLSEIEVLWPNRAGPVKVLIFTYFFIGGNQTRNRTGKKSPLQYSPQYRQQPAHSGIIEKHILQPTMWYVDSSAIKRAETHFTDGIMEWVLFFFLASISQTMLLCAKSCMNVFLSPWVIRGTVSKIEIKRANLTEARACYSSQQQLKELHMLKATHIQNLHIWKTYQFRPKVNFHWLKDITYKENTTLSIWDMLLVCTSPGLGYTKVQFVGRPIKQGRRVLLEPKRERILGHASAKTLQ